MLVLFKLAGYSSLLLPIAYFSIKKSIKLNIVVAVQVRLFFPFTERKE